jgi:hypothetical protein
VSDTEGEVRGEFRGRRPQVGKALEEKAVAAEARAASLNAEAVVLPVVFGTGVSDAAEAGRLVAGRAEGTVLSAALSLLLLAAVASESLVDASRRARKSPSELVVRFGAMKAHRSSLNGSGQAVENQKPLSVSACRSGEIVILYCGRPTLSGSRHTFT